MGWKRNCALTFTVALCLFSSISGLTAPLKIDIQPMAPTANEADALHRSVFQSKTVTAKLKGLRYRILAVEWTGPAEHPEKNAAVQVYDYTNDRLLTIYEVQDGRWIRINEDDHPLWPMLPSPEETRDAISIIEADPFFGPLLREKKLFPYEAMPAVIDDQLGASRRVLPVGLRSSDASTGRDSGRDSGHEIVSVDMVRRQVLRYNRRAPETAIASAHTCGPPSANQGVTRVGTTGSAQVIARDQNEVLWSFKVTRPSASSGAWGSGVELRDVKFKGQNVLRHAHAPILNVDYLQNACGPYRDQVNHENAFEATGQRITSGVLRASQLPKTIFETGKDRGNFWGVAIFEDQEKLVVMSEISAGWYRYVSEYQFYRDGRIRPVFKFDAVHNSCTCKAHNHHVYWRLEFDLGKTDGHLAEVLKGDEWVGIEKESRFIRSAQVRSWRITNAQSKAGYEIQPGPYDGTTNAFGKADAWVLKNNPREVDDFRFGRSKEAKIDQFMNNESIREGNLIFWYAGHILHSEEADEKPHVASPLLRPVIRP